MRTNVYIDGFNLYYGLFSNKKRQLPWKWLDLRALSERILPRGFQINRIRYFTADVVPRQGDPNQSIRQQIYLRALSTIPGLSIHKGKFLTNTKSVFVKQPVAIPAITPAVISECREEVERALQSLRVVEIERTEEKGSDVNLASFLMLDAATSDCETVMLISNDSDLAGPLELARQTWGVSVVVVNPQPNRPTVPLQRLASHYRDIRSEAVRSCQFPAKLQDDNGEFRIPAKWARDEQRYIKQHGG